MCVKMLQIEGTNGWGVLYAPGSSLPTGAVTGAVNNGNTAYMIGEIVEVEGGMYRWVYYARVGYKIGQARTTEQALTYIVGHRHREGLGNISTYRAVTMGGRYSLGQCQAPSLQVAYQLLNRFIVTALPDIYRSLWQQDHRVDIWNDKWMLCMDAAEFWQGVGIQ